MIFYMTVMAIIQYKSYKDEFKPEYKTWQGEPLILLKNLGRFLRLQLGTFVYVFCGMNSFH
jgi:hypothetical protein